MAKVLLQHSAGGLVYRHHNREVEVVMIKDSYGRWTFPKGHTEPGESLEETARREIAEEVGIDEHSLTTKLELGEIDYWFGLKTPGDFSHVQKIANEIARAKYNDLETLKTEDTKKDEPEVIHKFVTYYLFEAPADTSLTPQLNEVQEAQWVPADEVMAYNHYADNHQIINKALRYFSHYQ